MWSKLDEWKRRWEGGLKPKIKAEKKWRDVIEKEIQEARKS